MASRNQVSRPGVVLWIAGLALASTAAAAPAEPRDLMGDPLPAGALQRLGTLRMRYYSIAGLTYLPGELARAAVLKGNRVHLWDLAKGEMLSEVRLSESALVCVRVEADRQALLIGDRAGRVHEWHIAKQAVLRTWDTGIAGLRSACYSRDGQRLLAAGGRPPVVREFALDSGKLLVEIHSEMATTRCGAIYGPGRTAVLGGGYDHVLEHYDLLKGRRLHKWYRAYETKNLALSPDGRHVAAGVETHAAEWDLSTYEMLHKYAHAPADGGRVYCLAYLPRTNEVLCGGRDGSLYRWSRDTGKLVFRCTPHENPIMHLAVSEDEQWALSFGRGLLVETHLRTGQPRLQWPRHFGAVEAVAFLPSGRQVVSGSADGSLRLWDVATGKSALRITGCRLGAYALAVSPDGSRVAAGCKDSVIRIFSLSDAKLLRELRGHRGYVRGLAYTHRGGRLFSSADDGSICLWTPGRNEPAARLEGHRGGVLALALSSDDRQLLSAGRDGTVRVWDPATGRAKATYELHRSWAEAVAFVAQTGDAISTGGDGRLLRWNVASGQVVAEMKHRGWIFGLACSSDGTRACSAGSGRSVVCCWDLTKAAKVAELTGHAASVRAVAFSPDGQRIVSGSADSTLLVWRTPLPQP